MIDIYRKCSENFVLKDLIHCGETWEKYQSTINNYPKENDTLISIDVLCNDILEPVSDKFGKITLTYGFASTELTKLIKGRIYPKKDQHAGHEKDENDNYICPRLGQAVDFYIPNVNSKEVARWITVHTPFDRLYFYEDIKSLHVSVGPENKREIVKMTQSANTNRLIPKIVSNI